VVTAVTAQGAAGVISIEVMPASLVAAQLDAALEDEVAAVKVGMLGNASIVEVVAARLRFLRDVPIVVDPVLAASSGAPLLAADALAPLVERLFPLATLVTPNLPEAARLTGLPVGTELERLAAARALAARGCAVLLKGGHDDGALVVDLLVRGDGTEHLVHPRQVASARGTGCTLASAIAARLGRGEPLLGAVRGGVAYVQRIFAGVG
jgi:hydroxymethylpyrimidine/phosphomethylpyrimidine kinase